MNSDTYSREEQLYSAAGKTEHRLCRRYPLKLQLTYMAACNQALRLGYGVSIDISRTGILFWPDAELVSGTRVELSADWPATYKGQQLRLLMYGSVLRCDQRGAVALIERQSLVRDGAKQGSGANPEWDRILARFRSKLLRLGRSVELRRPALEDTKA